VQRIGKTLCKGYESEPHLQQHVTQHQRAEGIKAQTTSLEIS
jgi:hypothetical protein